MLKRALLATAAGLSILPVALAAPALTFSSIFDQLIKFLGPQGVDLLFAFGIVTTILYMALANVALFQKSAASKAGGALFAVLAGLATAFYIYINKIPFLAIMGPYLLLIVAIFLGLLLLSVAKSMVEGKSLASMLGVYGLGAFIIGILIIMLSPALAWIGILITVIGAILFIIGGVSWMVGAGGNKELGFFKITESEARSQLKNLRKQFKEDVIGEDELEEAQANLTKKAISILNEVVEEVQVRNYPAAIRLLGDLGPIITNELTETKEQLKVANDLMKSLKLQQRKISPTMRYLMPGQLDKEITQLDERLESLDTWRMQIEELKEQYENEGLAKIKLCIEALEINNIPQFEAQLSSLRALLSRLEKTVFEELQVSSQYKALMKELENFDERKERIVAAGMNYEKEIEEYERYFLIELEKLKKFVSVWNDYKGKKLADEFIVQAEKIIEIMERSTGFRQKLNDLIKIKEDVQELSNVINTSKTGYRGTSAQAQEAVALMYKYIGALENLVKREEEVEEEE